MIDYKGTSDEVKQVLEAIESITMDEGSSGKSSSKITSLVAQKRKDRLSVYVDGEFFCGISLDMAVRYGVVVGREYTEAELGVLLSESGENDLYLKALGYIVRSPRTEREITRFLLRKDAAPETVNKIIGRLKTMNYINDEAYAKLFTEQKRQKLGIGAIRNKLFTRGINSGLIEQSIDEVDGQTQEDLARRVADKYLRNKDRDFKTIQKLYRHLASKGFELDLSSQIVEEYKHEQLMAKEADEERMNEYQDKWTEYRRSKAEAKAKKKELKELKRQLLMGEEE